MLAGFSSRRPGPGALGRPIVVRPVADGAPQMVNKWLVTITVMLPTIIEIVDTSVVNVALPHIQGSMSAGLDEVTWVLTSYLVSNAIIIPMTGWLASLVGRKRYLLGSLVVFTAASCMCGLAGSLMALVFWRVVQGAAGGALQPISQAILFESFPPHQHGVAMAVFGMGVVLGPIIGPVMGGWITDNWSWRWIFYINIPVGIVAALMAVAFIFDPPYIKRSREARVDYWGLALLIVWVGCLQIMLDKGEREDWFASSFICWLGAISAAAFVAFIVAELKAATPVVNLRVFRDRTFTSGNLVMFFGFMGFFASIVMLPLYLQNLMGYTAYLAGMVLGPGGMATLLMMPVAGLLTDRVDARYLLGFGLACNAVSLYWMSGFNLDAGFWNVIGPRILQGVAIAFFFVPLMAVTFATIAKEHMGNAAGVTNFLRNLGGSVGVAVFASVLARRAQFHQSRLVEGLHPLSLPYGEGTAEVERLLEAQGLGGGAAEQGTLSLLYGQVLRHASMLSFNDVFWALAILFVCLLPLLLLLRRGQGKRPVGAH